MEKIKQALEKARLEREANGGGVGSIRSSKAASPEQAIQYSKTLVKSILPDLFERKHLVNPAHDNDVSRAFKILRTQVLQRMAARGWNALAITSPNPGDGKSLVAINLAISLAMELQYTVLLVDADLRKPSIHSYFEITPQYGLADNLQRDIPIGDILINPGVERLVLLPGREPVPNSSEVLSSPKMARLVDELKSRYPSRFVLFDMPPMLASDDVLAFSPFMDAVLFVINDGKSSKSDVEHSMDLLKDATVLGTVLNRTQEPLPAYY